RLLIGREDAVGERYGLDAGNGLEPVESGDGHGRPADHGGTDVEKVCANVGDGPIHAGLHALQNPEQGEGYANLKEDQRRAHGLAPDAGPDEREESHAAVLESSNNTAVRRKLQCPADRRVQSRRNRTMRITPFALEGRW